MINNYSLQASLTSLKDRIIFAVALKKYLERYSIPKTVPPITMVFVTVFTIGFLKKG